MKTNCNIVKTMYDRVIRRKLGLLCTDDTSNEFLLESYRNRLDCEIVDTSCYGDNKPCETATLIECGFTVDITYEVTEYGYCPINIDTVTLGVVYTGNPLVGWRMGSVINNVITSITSNPNYTGGITILNYKVVDNTGALVGGYLPNELPGTLQTVVSNDLDVYRINPIWSEVYFILEIEAQFDLGQGNHTIRFTYNQTVPQPGINTNVFTYTVTPTCEDLTPESVYVFTATPSGNVGLTTYTWNFNGLFWNLISQSGNTLILQPLYATGGSFVSVLGIDSRGCPATDIIKRLQYLAGCTDPDAVNYNPDATYNDGSCYYTPLTLTAGYTCSIDDTGDFCAVVTGGVPPYTLVGYPGGGEIITTDGGSYCEFLLNGTPWSLYAIDAEFNVTPIDSGFINCPFDCGKTEINPDVMFTCLIDGLGNTTGQCQVFASPFGGTAPYTITISVNGAPAVPFVNGSIYNNNDNIEIFVVDANGCEGYFMEKISCPPTIPGPFFGNCEDLAEYLKNNSTVFPVILNIVNSGPNLGPGYTVEYNVQWGTLGVPSPLTTANFAVVAANIQNNTTTNLTGQDRLSPTPGTFYDIVPFTGGLVLDNQVGILASYSPTVNCNPSILSPGDSARFIPGGYNLNVTVYLEFTVVVGSLICHLCGEALFSLDYDPCNFSPVGNSVNLSILTVCP
jgi:hypothetical protein